eukprot:1275124-Rhodomonas_salina.1
MSGSFYWRALLALPPLPSSLPSSASALPPFPPSPLSQLQIPLSVSGKRRSWGAEDEEKGEASEEDHAKRGGANLVCGVLARGDVDAIADDGEAVCAAGSDSVRRADAGPAMRA